MASNMTFGLVSTPKKQTTYKVVVYTNKIDMKGITQGSFGYVNAPITNITIKATSMDDLRRKLKDYQKSHVNQSEGMLFMITTPGGAYVGKMTTSLHKDATGVMGLWEGKKGSRLVLDDGSLDTSLERALDPIKFKIEFISDAKDTKGFRTQRTAESIAELRVKLINETPALAKKTSNGQMTKVDYLIYRGNAHEGILTVYLNGKVEWKTRTKKGAISKSLVDSKTGKLLRGA